MMSVLPLLPPEKIMLGFAEIGKLAVKKRVALKMKRLLQYWVRTWRPKLHVLSVSGCEDRTSNACESDNKTLQDAVRQKRPNIWDFMGKFPSFIYSVKFWCAQLSNVHYLTWFHQ